MSMKNSNDTIGNRSRNLPVCSAVPQPLRHSITIIITINFSGIVKAIITQIRLYIATHIITTTTVKTSVIWEVTAVA
jgi:hypothetical protein